jgi:hypothetical protein
MVCGSSRLGLHSRGGVAGDTSISMSSSLCSAPSLRLKYCHFNIIVILDLYGKNNNRLPVPIFAPNRLKLTKNEPLFGNFDNLLISSAFLKLITLVNVLYCKSSNQPLQIHIMPIRMVFLSSKIPLSAKKLRSLFEVGHFLPF